MGDAFWWRHLVATRGVFDRSEGAARERLRMAARGTVDEAIWMLLLGVTSRV
jgi:hypothetical protein